jgi:hypothetical protein
MPTKYIIDAAAGVALLFALLGVFFVDWLLRPGVAPTKNTLNVMDVKEDAPKVKRLKLAVTPTHQDTNPLTKKPELWDDMGKLLRNLGKGYDEFDIVEARNLLSMDPKKLQEYDVLFFTCAPKGQELKDVLRNYVANGGILYASDWRYDAVAAAFPDFVDRSTQSEGDVQKLEADIVDPALRDIIGKQIHLSFTMDQWKTAAFGGPRVQTLIRSKYVNMKKQTAEAPLMVKFNFDKGTVIFTSFHNEAQNSADEEKLLKYLIFSLVTAGVESEVKNEMNKLGFQAQSSNLLSSPQLNQSISKEHKLKERAALRFSLGFRSEGAELRLNIKSPDGKEFTWQGKSTKSLEVPNAMPGTWTYTVTAIHLPYPNFPFTMTVGEKK